MAISPNWNHVYASSGTMPMPSYWGYGWSPIPVWQATSYSPGYLSLANTPTLSNSPAATKRPSNDRVDFSVLTNRPNTPNKAGPRPHRGFKHLGLIKVFGTGIITGAIDVSLFGAPAYVAFPVEMLNGVIETHVAKLIYAANKPWSRGVLALSHRLLGGSPKSVDRMTAEEKERCIIPLSSLVTGTGTATVAAISYLLNRNKASHKSASLASLQAAVGKAGHWGTKALARMRLWGHYAEHWGPIQTIRKNPALMIPAAGLYGMCWGLLEGFAAHKLSKHPGQAGL